MIPDARLQQLIQRKDADEALVWCREHGYGEGWAIIDGALVIYDHEDPPAWLAPILALCDEDGNTPAELASVTPMRAPRDGEYADPQPDLVPLAA